MANKCYLDAFAEVLEASEPRIPIMTLHLERDGACAPPMHERDVRVVLTDNLTCNEIGEYNIDPVSALHLLHKASQFALDCELVDPADFTVELYAVVNAWYHDTYSKLDTLERPTQATCSLSDALCFLTEAHQRKGGPVSVTIEEVHWLVG